MLLNSQKGKLWHPSRSSWRFQMLENLCLGSDLAPHHSSELTKTQKVMCQVWPRQQASKTSRVARVQNDGCEQRAMKSAGFAYSKNGSPLKCLLQHMFQNNGNLFLFNSLFKVMFVVQNWSSWQKLRLSLAKWNLSLHRLKCAKRRQKVNLHFYIWIFLRRSKSNSREKWC